MKQNLANNNNKGETSTAPEPTTTTATQADVDDNLLNRILKLTADDAVYYQNRELVYIPFDILYCQHAAKIKFPLTERHRLLKECVKPASVPVPGISGICTRVEPLLPGETRFGGVLASKIASTVKEIRVATEYARQHKEEGIIIKALDSQWVPGSRSYHWLKIKPDYITKQEIDAVVLGGWYSKSGGRSCAGITQYLMGLVKKPLNQGDQPTTFITFCRVGTGLDEQQRASVNEKLMPMSIADRSAKPSCVIATGPASEQPDVWVKDPFKSLVFEVHGDLRFITSINYASRVSLRFPRINQIRDNKDAATANYEDTIVQESEEKRKVAIENDNARSTPGGKKRRRNVGGGSRAKKVRVIARGRAKKLAAVQSKTDILKGRIVYVMSPPPGYKAASSSSGVKANVASWRAVVKELGGKPALSYASLVTDVVAATLDDKVVDFIKKNPKMSILTPGWLIRCLENNVLCPLRPRDFLYLAPDDPRRPPSEEADRFGDYYYQDVETEDVEALLQYHIKEKDVNVDEVVTSLLAAAAPLLLVDSSSPSPSLLPAATVNNGGSSASSIFANGVSSLNKLEEYTAAVEKRDSLRFSGRTLLGWLDSELAAVGMLDVPRSLLHGCTVFLLEITTTLNGSQSLATSTEISGLLGLKNEEKEEENLKTSFSAVLTATKEGETAAVEAEVAARRLRLSRLKLTAQMHGAKVVSEMTPEVTHLVGVVVVDSPANSTTAAADATTTAATAAAAAAISSPDSDTLLAALKSSSAGDGRKAVRVLHESLVEAESIQLVSSDWIEAAAATAAATAAGRREGSDDATLQPPDAAQFPLMDAEVMEDVSAWRWTHYAPLPRPTSAAGGGTGGRGGGARGRQRARGRGAAGVARGGEIIYVPSTRRGTAIQSSRSNTHNKSVSSQITATNDGFNSGAGGVSGGAGGGNSKFSDSDAELGSVAEFELEDVPKVKNKPRAAQKMNTAVAEKKKKGGKNDADRPPLPPASTVSAVAPALTPAAVEEDDEHLRMLEYFGLKPKEEETKPAPFAAAAPPSAAAAVPPAAPFPIKSDPPAFTAPSSTAVPAPLQQQSGAPPAAAAPTGGGAPKMSLKEKIRLMKEAKEKNEAGK
jgi:hypothetical protein